MGLPKHGLLQSTVVYHEFHFFARGKPYVRYSDNFRPALRDVGHELLIRFRNSLGGLLKQLSCSKIKTGCWSMMIHDDPWWSRWFSIDLRSLWATHGIPSVRGPMARVRATGGDLRLWWWDQPQNGELLRWWELSAGLRRSWLRHRHT